MDLIEGIILFIGSIYLATYIGMKLGIQYGTLFLAVEIIIINRSRKN